MGKPRKSTRVKVSDFQRGAISAMRSQGITCDRIAEALGCHVNTIYNQLKTIREEGQDPFVLSTEIIKHTLPMAALRQAQAVLDDSDTERADQASYRMLKGGGVYQEQTIQTHKSVPDSEIMLSMADMLMSALEQAAVPAEYTVTGDKTGPETGDKPTQSGAETAGEQAEASEETDTKPQVKTLQELRQAGQSLGAMIARTNAERMIAKADRNRTEGRPDDDISSRPK